jgi:capsular polysaccharide biosynthesis protein
VTEVDLILQLEKFKASAGELANQTLELKKFKANIEELLESGQLLILTSAECPQCGWATGVNIRCTFCQIVAGSILIE